MKVINNIGLGGFAAAMMWVLNEDCFMPKEWMLCKPEAKAGRFLLEEIMQAGYFGKYDSRNEHRPGEGAFRRNRRKWKRLWQFVRYYPAEVLSIPFWKLWYWCWRKKKGYL